MTRYVCVKGSGGGGLGDAIRALLTGILYAKLSGRILCVDWAHGVFADKGVNAFFELFDIEDLAVSECPSTNSVRPDAWRGHLHDTMHELYTSNGHDTWDRSQTIQQYSFDMSVLDYTEQVLVMWEFDQFNKLVQVFNQREGASFADNELLAHLMQKHVKLNKSVQTKVDEFCTAHFSGSILGVHVRKTHEAKIIRPLVELDAYFNVIDRIFEMETSASIFLATDNADVINAFKERYKDVVTRDKWFAKPGESLHLNNICPDLLENTVDALVEMFLLARTNYLITPNNSSFSMISRIASNNPKNNIFLLSANDQTTSVVKKFANLFIPKQRHALH